MPAQVDLNAPDVVAFYNAQSADALSLSMRCAAAPFSFRGATHATLEDCWRSLEGESIEARRALLADAIRAQCTSEAAMHTELSPSHHPMPFPVIPCPRPFPTIPCCRYTSEAAAAAGLADHLRATHPKTVVCVDIDPWLGMQVTTCTACSNVPPCVHARVHPSRVPGVCVDLGPWLGMQAAGGISAGQNGMGRALMAVRDELRAAADGR